MNTLRRYIPILDWARTYSRQWLRLDLTAGLSSSAVVLPKAMAYAAIAALPVQVGLYTALMPLVIYAVFGTSRVLSVSTTTTLAILSGAQFALVDSPDSSTLLAAVATLAVITGLILILAFAMRLGFLANFISESVLTGFKTGIGIVIIVDQLPKMLGIHFHKASFFQNLLQTIAHVPETSILTLVFGLATLALLFALEHYTPRTPAPLIAVALGIVGSALGLKNLGLETVGTVDRGLPSLTMPDWSLAETMWLPALGIALMSYTESVAAMRAFARTTDPRPNPNQELLALGLANLGAGLFGGMPAGGGTTQTAVNCRCGAQTQLSGLITAAMSMASLLLLAPVIGLMPQATLAAIVIAYSLELIKLTEFREIRKIRTTEFWWAVIAVVGIVLLGTLKGILVAVIASLASLVQQTNNPPVYALGRKRGTDQYRDLHTDDEVPPGLLIVRVEGRIYFGNSQRISEKILHLIEQYHPKVLLLDCRGIFDLEFSAMKMLERAETTLRKSGITLWLVALNPHVHEMLEHAPLGKILGKERIFERLHPTVEYYETFSPAPQ